MSSYFFRVEHDLLRSEAFKSLGGSAVKVYLVLGLYSDFGTDWAFPSIRTIARQSGLSRQTVLTAIDQLVESGLLATTKSKGRSTAYRLIRPAAVRPSKSKSSRNSTAESESGLISFVLNSGSGPISLQDRGAGGLNAGPEPVQNPAAAGRGARPKQEARERDDTTSSIAITGTPFQITAEGEIVVVSDLQEDLTKLGLSARMAHQLIARHEPERVARIVLNALHLQAQGKLRNGPGYIRTAIEEGYELLPQVAARLETRRRELQTHLQQAETVRQRSRQAQAREDEEAAITYVLEKLGPIELEGLLQRALEALPDAIARRNPTLSNPFVRAKVYELACGDPSA